MADFNQEKNTQTEDACNHADEEKIPNSESSSELDPTISDSLSDDYVHVEQVPGRESEEVRNLYNQPSILSGYLGYVPSMSLSSILPGWLYPAEVSGDLSTNTDASEGQMNYEEWVSETIKGVYTGSIEEEGRFRDCLVRAISDHFDGMKVADVDFFAQSCSVTKEELHYARDSETQFTRRILLILLRRDTKTILSFLFRLFKQAKGIVMKAIISLHRYLEEGYKKQVQCLRCLLIGRVCICLIVDHLPTCDSELLSFVNVVSEENQPARPSVSEKLWNELLNTLTNRNVYVKVIQLLINVIESSGYHSDIVRMLKEDQELNRDSFICRCQEIAGCQAINSARCQKQQQSLDPHSVSNMTNEQRVVEVQSDQIIATEVVHPIAQSSSSCRDVNATEHNDTREENQNDDILEGDEYVKRPSGKEEKGKTTMYPPKRKKPDSRSEDEVLKKKPPDTSMVLEEKAARGSSSNRLKRKETSGGHVFNGKRSKNDHRNKSGSSCVGNCDLQMEMLKIGIPGLENEHDSWLSLPSTSSDGDSGVYVHTNLFSKSVDHEETVPKEVVNDLKLSTLAKAGDQNEKGELTNESPEETHESMPASNESDIGSSGQTQMKLNSNQNNIEEEFSESLDSSLRRDCRGESDEDE